MPSVPIFKKVRELRPTHSAANEKSSGLVSRRIVLVLPLTISETHVDDPNLIPILTLRQGFERIVIYELGGCRFGFYILRTEGISYMNLVDVALGAANDIPRFLDRFHSSIKSSLVGCFIKKC